MKTGKYETRAELRDAVLADVLTLQYSWGEMAQRHGISMWVFRRVWIEVADAYCAAVRALPD